MQGLVHCPVVTDVRIKQLLHSHQKPNLNVRSFCFLESPGEERIEGGGVVDGGSEVVAPLRVGFR